MKELDVTMIYAEIPALDGEPYPFWVARVTVDGVARAVTGQDIDVLAAALADEIRDVVRPLAPRSAQATPEGTRIGLDALRAIGVTS